MQCLSSVLLPLPEPPSTTRTSPRATREIDPVEDGPLAVARRPARCTTSASAPVIVARLPGS